MKRIIIITLSILVILSIITVSIFALTELNTETQPDTLENENIDEIVIHDGVFSMSELSLDANISAFNETLILSSFDNIESIIEKNDNVEFKFEDFIIPNSDSLQPDGTYKKLNLISYVSGFYDTSINFDSKGAFQANTQIDQDALKYIMFLSMLMNQYPDNVLSMSKQHYYLSLQQPGYLLVSFDYKELGYDTIADYVRAVNKGEVAPGNNTYLIGYSDMSIHKCGVDDSTFPLYQPFSVGPNLIDTFLNKNDHVVE